MFLATNRLRKINCWWVRLHSRYLHRHEHRYFLCLLCCPMCPPFGVDLCVAQVMFVLTLGFEEEGGGGVELLRGRSSGMTWFAVL